MKRFPLTSLVLLFAMSTSGQVLAAALCPHALGRECCFAKTANRTHSPSSGHVNKVVADMHMDGMPMDGMNMDEMARGDASMDHNAMDDMVIDPAIVEMSTPFSRLAFGEDSVASKFEEPVESCAHCLGHSGIVNAPVSSLSALDQSGKDFRSVLLPVSKFLSPPAIALTQIGLPAEHAPPSSSVPRHILTGVFMI